MHLGYGLHPLQDIPAHTAEFVKENNGVYYHDQGFSWTPYADNTKYKRERLDTTEVETMKYIQAFYERTKEDYFDGRSNSNISDDTQ